MPLNASARVATSASECETPVSRRPGSSGSTVRMSAVSSCSGDTARRSRKNVAPSMATRAAAMMASSPSVTGALIVTGVTTSSTPATSNTAALA